MSHFQSYVRATSCVTSWVAAVPLVTCAHHVPSRWRSLAFTWKAFFWSRQQLPLQALADYSSSVTYFESSAMGHFDEFIDILQLALTFYFFVYQPSYFYWGVCWLMTIFFFSMNPQLGKDWDTFAGVFPLRKATFSDWTREWMSRWFPNSHCEFQSRTSSRKLVSLM